MSAVAVLLQFLFAFLGFLLSIYGVFTVLLGLVGFIALPVVPRITGEFKRLANLHLWLATSMLTRIGVVVSKHGDLLLKRMRFDDRGVEKIRFDDIDKEFADPAARLHYWMGVPFSGVNVASIPEAEVGSPWRSSGPMTRRLSSPTSGLPSSMSTVKPMVTRSRPVR